MILSLSVAIGHKWQIGKDNKLLWHIPAELKNFKDITMGKHMLMGRKTFESIGKALPGRISLVLSRNIKSSSSDDLFWFNDIDKAVEFAKSRGEEELVVIGGEAIYKEILPRVDRLYLTQVDFDGEADAFFPVIDDKEWEKIYESESFLPKDGAPAWRKFILNRRQLH